MHPEYQDRVFDELKSVCDSAFETVTYETICKMQYLEMVIKETMRLFPIAPILGRNCLADTKISSCTIPKGSLVAIIIYHMHRKPNIWGSDAEDFNPDHFLPEQIAGRHTYSYLPFRFVGKIVFWSKTEHFVCLAFNSGGQRNCIVSSQSYNIEVIAKLKKPKKNSGHKIWLDVNEGGFGSFAVKFQIFNELKNVWNQRSLAWCAETKQYEQCQYGTTRLIRIWIITLIVKWSSIIASLTIKH